MPSIASTNVAATWTTTARVVLLRQDRVRAGCRKWLRAPLRVRVLTIPAPRPALTGNPRPGVPMPGRWGRLSVIAPRKHRRAPSGGPVHVCAPRPATASAAPAGAATGQIRRQSGTSTALCVVLVSDRSPLSFVVARPQTAFGGGTFGGINRTSAGNIFPLQFPRRALR